jgi:hypothetical protein
MPDPVQEVTLMEGSIIGAAPVPYAPKVIGCPAEPEEGITSDPCHISPFLNRMESPAEKEEPFTFEIVFQAAPVEVPALLSFPPVWST